MEEGWEARREAEWDAWHAAMPSEEHVTAIARGGGSARPASRTTRRRTGRRASSVTRPERPRTERGPHTPAAGRRANRPTQAPG